MHYEVITLYYISAAEAQKLVAPILSEYGSVTPTTAAAVDTVPGTGGDTLAIQDKIVHSLNAKGNLKNPKLIETCEF